MSKRKRKGRRRPNRTVSEAKAILNETVELARKVINECGNNRTANPQNFWIFTLLASMASSSRSVPVLLDARQYWDLKLVVRSINDACIDILYLLHDPSMTKELIRLLQIELAVDEYEYWKHVTGRHAEYAKDYDDLPAEKREKAAMRFLRAERAYKQAQLHPAFRASSKDWPKRWRKITHQEKIKAIEKVSEHLPTERLSYEMRDMGNAAAHRRSRMLRDFWKPVETKYSTRFSYTTKPKMASDMGPSQVLILAPFACLLLATWKVIEAYRLGDIWDKQAQRLIDKWGARFAKEPKK
jgi:hypothetical protein